LKWLGDFLSSAIEEVGDGEGSTVGVGEAGVAELSRPTEEGEEKEVE
jgi:hypothetical protein